MPEPIWLVGMMGSGKSTVAPLVAAALDRAWVDTDQMIIESTGAEIAELLEDGRFRDIEHAVISSLADSDVVAAVGGGAVTSDAAQVMSTYGFVAWLRADAAVLAQRVGDGSGRPLLGRDPRQDLERLAAERASQYEACADVVIDTADLDPERVAELVVEAWKSA